MSQAFVRLNFLTYFCWYYSVISWFSTCILPIKLCHFILQQVKVSSKHSYNDESITNLYNDTLTDFCYRVSDLSTVRIEVHLVLVSSIVKNSVKNSSESVFSPFSDLKRSTCDSRFKHNSWWKSLLSPLVVKNTNSHLKILPIQHIDIMKNPVTATYFECIGVLNFLRDLHGSSDYQKVLLYNYLFPLISSVGLLD